MNDIFISYSRNDKNRIEKFINTLESYGFKIWWDRKILPGEDFEKEIKKALNEAKCVVVIWSKISVTKNFVKNEANLANKYSKLIPIIIDKELDPSEDIPLGLNHLQVSNLSSWNGKKDAQEFQKLLESLVIKTGHRLQFEDVNDFMTTVKSVFEPLDEVAITQIFAIIEITTDPYYHHNSFNFIKEELEKYNLLINEYNEFVNESIENFYELKQTATDTSMMSLIMLYKARIKLEFECRLLAAKGAVVQRIEQSEAYWASIYEKKLKSEKHFNSPPNISPGLFGIKEKSSIELMTKSFEKMNIATQFTKMINEIVSEVRDIVGNLGNNIDNRLIHRGLFYPR